MTFLLFVAQFLLLLVNCYAWYRFGYRKARQQFDVAFEATRLRAYLDGSRTIRAAELHDLMAALSPSWYLRKVEKTLVTDFKKEIEHFDGSLDS